jgi:hypothetical protein
LCGHCHGFDTLSWRAPSTGGPSMAKTPVIAAAIEPPPLLPMPDDLASVGQSAR